MIAASPAYLARAGRPLRAGGSAPATTACARRARQWSFNKDGVESTVRVSGPLRSNNGELLCRAAVDGLGLIRASELEVPAELHSGKLVQVLPDYEVATNAALWALYPSAKHVLPRMRALLDFLADWFRDARGKPDQRQRAQATSASERRSEDPGARRLTAGRRPRHFAKRSSMRRTVCICGPLRVRYSRPV